MKSYTAKKYTITSLLLGAALVTSATAQPQRGGPQPPSAEDVTSFVFESYDYSGEGLVDETELVQALADLHEQRQPQQDTRQNSGRGARAQPDHSLAAKRVLALGDADGDGLLNPTEMLNGFERFQNEMRMQRRGKRADQSSRSS